MDYITNEQCQVHMQSEFIAQSLMGLSASVFLKHLFMDSWCAVNLAYTLQRFLSLQCGLENFVSRLVPRRAFICYADAVWLRGERITYSSEWKMKWMKSIHFFSSLELLSTSHILLLMDSISWALQFDPMCRLEWTTEKQWTKEI